VIRVLVLGAAAGGGFPQWNSNSEACRRARAGDPSARPATQASIAVSADGDRWFLINASPDLREQINRQPQLHPKEGLRSSPIAGVVLTNGDVDAIAGLLNLRERTPFVVCAHPRILDVLAANPIFEVLAPDVVQRSTLALNEKIPLRGADGRDSGLVLEAFSVPGKVALFMEDASRGESFGTEEGDTIGLEISEAHGASRLLFIANCAKVDEAVRARCQGASLVFFDGTLWRDEEMIARGEGRKTGQRMGHISMAGEEGSMAALSGLDIGQRVFIHINNTNPALLADRPERREIEAAGWQVAYDGMEIVLP
jgi:pyrroloquinoline quinone biosynthesis protein B